MQKVEIDISGDDVSFLSSLVHYSRILSGIQGSPHYASQRFRHASEQHPVKIKKESVPLDNKGQIDVKGLRGIVESTKEGVILVCRDEDGNLAETLYLPPASNKGPYTRELFF